MGSEMCIRDRDAGGRPLRDDRPSPAPRLACLTLGLALDLVGRGDMTRPIRSAGRVPTGRSSVRRAPHISFTLGRPVDADAVSDDPLSVLGRQSTVRPQAAALPSSPARFIGVRPAPLD